LHSPHFTFLLLAPPSCSITTHAYIFYSDDPPPEGGGGGGDLTDADIDSNWEETIETFDAMGLPEELLRGIYAYGFEKPSAIQQRAIKPTMLGRDLIAQAQSGTVSLLLYMYCNFHLFVAFICTSKRTCVHMCATYSPSPKE
jgi:hypothetical protein